MSIPVPLATLRAAVEERRSSAYLLTVSDDGSPHAVHVAVRWEGDRLVAPAGRHSAANATARPAVSLLYAVRSAGDYSLIVDGTAAVEPSESGGRVVVTPTRAVLHRTGVPSDPGSSCAADCVPLLPAASDKRT